MTNCSPPGIIELQLPLALASVTSGEEKISEGVCVESLECHSFFCGDWEEKCYKSFCYRPVLPNCSYNISLIAQVLLVFITSIKGDNKKQMLGSWPSLAHSCELYPWTSLSVLLLVLLALSCPFWTHLNLQTVSLKSSLRVSSLFKWSGYLKKLCYRHCHQVNIDSHFIFHSRKARKAIYH